MEQEHTKPPPSSHPSESPTKAHSPRRVRPRECHRQTSCDGVTDSSSDDDDDDADLVDRRSEEEYSDEEEYCMLVRGGEREEGEMGGVERRKGGKRREERMEKKGGKREEKWKGERAKELYNNLYFFLPPSPVQFATVLPTLCGHCVVMTFSTATCTRMPLQTTLLRHPPSPPRYVHTPLE